MSYVRSFRHDVFVSYSTIDNEVMVEDGGVRRGWVDALIDKLRIETSSRLGVRDLRFFVDHGAIRSNLPITSQLIEAARNSATLLIVMSPSYLRSDWCRRELNAFLSVVRHRVAKGSVFLVRARPVGHHDQPEELRDLRGIQFYSSDADSDHRYRLLGNPSTSELSFVDRVCTLGEELALQLDRLPEGTPLPGCTAGERVFVAKATEDLEDREEELRNYLAQAGLQVFPTPQSRHTTSSLEAYEAAVLSELRACRVFAQLLSAIRGRELDFAAPRRLPALQAELARRTGADVLQWRDRDLDVASVRDPGHRALLDAARACGIEEFKRTVVERARRIKTPPRQTSDQVAVFVNADTKDRDLAKELCAELSRMDVDCYYPIEDGAPDEIRADLEDNLLHCDGLMLVYGASRLDWVYQQLRHARRITSERVRPLRTIAVYDGPPDPKPSIAVAIANLQTLHCRRGRDSHTLRGFVDTLRGNAP